MSNQTPANNEQKMPTGFDPDTWASLTPEQQQAYTQPQSQANPQMAQAQTDEMIKDMKKKVWYSMIFGVIISMFSRVVAELFGNSSKE
jgi:hypothetical protein